MRDRTNYPGSSLIKGALLPSVILLFNSVLNLRMTCFVVLPAPRSQIVLQTSAEVLLEIIGILVRCISVALHASLIVTTFFNNFRTTSACR